MISQNPSTKTLSSNDTRKLGLNGVLKICKFLNNGALKNTFSKFKYIQERFGKVNLFEIMKIVAFL